MGYRLHVAKKYQIEYAYHESFNHRSEDFVNLLDMFEVDRYNLSQADYADDIFEVERDKFEDLIEKLRSIRANEFELDEDQYDEFKVIIKELDYSDEYSLTSLDRVISELELLLESADKDKDYILFSWY